MIVIDKNSKNLVIPNGLGNINRDYQEGYEAGNQESFEIGKAEGLAEGKAEGLAEGKVIGIAEGKQIQKDLLESITITENGTYNKEDGYNQVVVDVPDLNGSYDEGYEAGETEQKSKLTNITISENGTYSREDGYNEITVDVPDTNGSYDEGYNIGYDAGIANAGEIIAQTARVLDVTENGSYLSQYSEPIYPDMITGVYPDGKNFYNYAELNGAVYNTKIAGSIDSRLEFWYKGDNMKAGDAYNLIIGSGDADNSDCFQVRYQSNLNDRLWIELGNSRIAVNDWDDTVWHHFIVSKAEGLWIDGEKKGDFSPSNTVNGEFYINGIGYDVNIVNNGRNANGTFGMIKIDDVVIIPTADGFLNTSTNELLEVVKDGSYYFTEELPIIPEGNLIKTINVNVVPKINVAENDIKFGYSNFTEVPDFYDFEGVTDMSYMFYGCTRLQTIPLIDTSNVTGMSYTFQNCNSLSTISLIDTSNVIKMESMFQNCNNLQTIPLINTSNVTDMNRMFYYCEGLQTIPLINTSNVTDMNRMFFTSSGIQSLISLPKFNVPKLTNISAYFYSKQITMNNLTEVGGWENLKCNWNDNGGLVCLPNLTYQSCLNVLNGLYDFTGNGEVPNSSQGQLKVHQNFLDLVGDEISIGTNKGWTITA